VGQTCFVFNASGTVSAAVSNISVNCTTNAGVSSFSVGGAVSGLAGTGLVLLNNGGNALAVSSSGSFSFSSQLTQGSSYNVSVGTQPLGQTCSVSNGSGTVSANVNSVTVSCTTNAGVSTFTVGGTVSGLSGTLQLSNNGGEPLVVKANGSFAFPLALTNGSSYSVTRVSQPANQTCTVSNGNGTIAGANITSVSVQCVTQSFTVTPSAGVGGSITPDSPQIVAAGGTVSFTLNASPGYQIAGLTGNCGGGLSGNVFTTSPVNADCAVQANFSPLTSTTLTASPNPARTGQLVTLTVQVSGTASAPVGGTVAVTASTGESCASSTPSSTSGNVRMFSCALSFATLGMRTLSASYTGSSSHEPSTSEAIGLAVMRIADIAVTVDDGEAESLPGEAVSYLVELRNLGPDSAPGTLIGVGASPALLNPVWTCSAQGGASCPAVSGSGLISQLVNLPANGRLDYVLSGTLPATLPSMVVISAIASVDGQSPNFVHDPVLSNNQADDINTGSRIFRDGFETPESQ
jgi:uncharacterized protein (UPF0179 family)